MRKDTRTKTQRTNDRYREMNQIADVLMIGSVEQHGLAIELRTLGVFIGLANHEFRVMGDRVVVRCYPITVV